MPDACYYRVSIRTSWPGVRILWLGETAIPVFKFYFSVAARTIVSADPSLRQMLHVAETASNQHTTTTTTRSASVDRPSLSFSSRRCHPSLPASSLWRPRCPPPADRQMFEPVLRRSFCHASIPTKLNRQQLHFYASSNDHLTWGASLYLWSRS